MRLALQNGSVLQISPGHPTADGRRFDTLVRGERLDGVEILAADLVPYGHDATYDILPDSDTGAYFAGGVLIGSTLAGHRCQLRCGNPSRFMAMQRSQPRSISRSIRGSERCVRQSWSRPR